MKQRRVDPEAKDRETLSRAWREWQAGRLKALLSGPYSEPATALVAFLKDMTIEDAGELVDLVKRGPWQFADRDTRFQVISTVDVAITRLRMKHSLPPFDDPLPGERDNCFLIIRDFLGDGNAPPAASPAIQEDEAA